MSHLLEELEKSTNTGCWEYIIENKELIWSNETYRIHAVPIGQKVSVEEATDFYHLEDQAKIQKAFKKCLGEGEDFRESLRIIDAHGKEKRVESYGKPLFKMGKLHSIFGTFKDITAEYNLKKHNVYSDLEFMHFKNTVNEFAIIASTDINGNITDVNGRFCEISGYSKKELLGKNHRIVNSGFHDKKFFKQMWDTIKMGFSWEGQICNKAKDGSLYWVQTFIFPNFDSDRKILGFTSFRYDVTDKVNALSELVEEREKATFASQLASVGEMSASITHEINNPLTIILSRASQLGKVRDNDELLDKIQKSITN